MTGLPLDALAGLLDALADAAADPRDACPCAAGGFVDHPLAPQPFVPGQIADRLLRPAGAEVTLAWQPAGHALTQADVVQTREWLAAVPITPWS